MKAGFLKGGKSSREEREDAAGTKTWSEDMLIAMAEVLKDVLEENSAAGRMDLERRVRSGTGAKEVITGHGHIHYVNPEDAQNVQSDVASRLIAEHTKLSSLQDYVPAITEQTATMFEKVVARGRQEGQSMNAETELQVQRDIMKECLVRHILKSINTANSESYAAGSSDAGLLATPQGYFGGDLNSLSGDCIRDLMEKGYGVVDNFLGGKTVEDVFSEMEYLDFDGKFTDVQQQKMIGMRSDKISWLSFDDLDREKQPGLGVLCKKLISIPFELNLKCSLMLQANATFQLSLYGKRAYYKKHVDSGYESLNNGRKITAIYYANPNWSEGDGGQLRVYKRRPNPYQIAAGGVDADPPDLKEEEIEPRGDRLVLLRSRDVPHEVMESRCKRFAVSLWLMGPPGPGDQPDSHHART